MPPFPRNIMTCSVKYRTHSGGEWQVVHNVEADSYREAERKVRHTIARDMGLPESDFDVKAYRTDAKSVWHKN